ncbi:hypothetical protein KA977_06015 [Candidatus Dependentiae bacterium]|nr:hypothetical protein [Candidatus Dependentiae bacterium]
MKKSNYINSIIGISLFFIIVYLYRYGNPLDMFEEITGGDKVFSSFFQTLFFFGIGILLFSAVFYYILNGNDLISGNKEKNKGKEIN